MKHKAIQLISSLTLFALFASIISGGLFFFSSSNSAHASGFPAHISAPYIDVGLSTAIDSLASSSGNKYVTAAFVNSNGCSPAWPNGAISTTAVNNIRNSGGDVIVSFGGYSGTELALACSSASSLQQQYQSIVNTYGLSYLDFDIEHGVTDSLSNTAATDRRNIALAGLQAANPGLKISYTLPAITSGITSESVNLLNNAKSHGVVVDRVNIMVMDYGGAIADMGQAAISASQGTINSAGITYAHLGITAMIGQNDSAGEIFTWNNAQTVLTFAQQNGVAELAFWSLNRDNGGCPGNTTAQSTCSGLSQGNYDYSHLWEQFNGGSPPPPPSSSSNLALNKPAFASSNESGSTTPNLAVDGNTATRWSSGYADPQWYYVDLGQVYNINHVRVNWEAAYAKSFNIQVSNDAASWANVYGTTSGTGGVQDINFTATNARYVKMYGTQRATAYGYSMWEFEVYDSTPLVGKTISLNAQVNGKYVTANINATGNPLQSTATTAQGWEKYIVIDEGNGNIALQSMANNNYVSANVGATNAPLQATASIAQAWEMFKITDLGGGYLALKSTQNGLYVTADLNNPNTPLEAKASTIQAWEKFQYTTY